MKTSFEKIWGNNSHSDIKAKLSSAGLDLAVYAS